MTQQTYSNEKVSTNNANNEIIYTMMKFATQLPIFNATAKTLPTMGNQRHLFIIVHH